MKYQLTYYVLKIHFLSFHLRLDLRLDFPNKILYAILISPVRATGPAVSSSSISSPS